MTYGDEQEAASAALLTIIRSDPTTADPGLLLACRRQAHLAIGDRIRMLQIRKRLDLPQRARRTLDASTYPVELIADVHRTTPQPPTPSLAPSDIMTGPAPDRVVAAWQALARHLTVGNSDLRRWADEPLRTDKRRAYLLADLATTMDGFVLADQRLADAGLLIGRPPDAYLQARLAMGNVARVTSWSETDPTPDHAVPDAPAVRTMDGFTISLIQRAGDYAFAQRNLARLMRPVIPQDTLFTASDRRGLHAARAIAAGQIRLAPVFAAWADRVGSATLADRFRERAERYAEFNRAMMRLVEKQPIRSPHVVAQQSEMVQQMIKHSGARPTLNTVAAIETASHQLTVNVGRVLRPETIKRQNILVLGDGEEVRPITNTREKFVVACRRLANEPAMAPSELARARQFRDRLALDLAGPARRTSHLSR